MSEKTYLKTFCKKCGGKIEFPDYARGEKINCPHCGQETILSVASAAPIAAAIPAAAPPGTTSPGAAPAAAAPARPATPETPGPAPKKVATAAGAAAITAAAAAAVAAMDKAQAKARSSPPPAANRSTANNPSKISAALASPLDAIYDELDSQKKKESCPSCSSRIDVGLSVCPTCGAGLVKHVRIIRRYGGLLLVALIIAAPFLLPRNVKIPIAALEKQKNKFTPPTKPDIEMINPAWSKAKEGKVNFISGTVINNTTEYRFLGVKVEFELLDKAGNPLGKTVDQVGILEPKKTWTFRAVAIDPDATSFKFVSLTSTRARAEKPATDKAPAAKEPPKKDADPKPAAK